MAMLRTTVFVVAIMLGATASAESDSRKAKPLFSSNDLLEVSIKGPFTTIMRERKLDKELPAVLTYNDTEAGEVSVGLDIRTRGRFSAAVKSVQVGAAPAELQKIDGQEYRVRRRG